MSKSFRFRDPEWFDGLPKSEQDKIKSDIRRDKMILRKWSIVVIAAFVYIASVLLLGLGTREFFEIIGLGTKETNNNLFVLPWMVLAFMLFVYIRSAIVNHPYFILAGILKK